MVANKNCIELGQLPRHSVETGDLAFSVTASTLKQFYNHDLLNELRV